MLGFATMLGDLLATACLMALVPLTGALVLGVISRLSAQYSSAH